MAEPIFLCKFTIVALGMWAIIVPHIICGMPYSLNICFVRSITTLLVFWCRGIFLTKETLEKKSVIIGYSSSST